MNFAQQYSHTDFTGFLRNELLPDDFITHDENLKIESGTKRITGIKQIGVCPSLKLKCYEAKHSSVNDPRVELSRDIYKIMNSFGTERALVIFTSPNSKQYRLSLVTIELSLEGSKVNRKYSNPKRFSFLLGPGAKIHTPTTFLIGKGRIKDFADLQSRFSIEVVNKEFYEKIAGWYFWANKVVQFPKHAEEPLNGRQIALIRLITRLIFIWFMKVRNLVPEALFDEATVKDLLVSLKPEDTTYYKAILQNLFFATLNTRKDERRFTSKVKGYKGFSTDFGNHNVYRYENLFRNSDEVIEKYFLPIAFLNGGLFECLDFKSPKKDERKYVDGFTNITEMQPAVPNYLFFSKGKEVDLSEEFGTKKKTYSVSGILDILSLYNFTIDEGSANDADVALDPELLGRVFENLLASYNPETAKPARKATGSYYTPRPIVDFMVDESLKQYLITHLVAGADKSEKIDILFNELEVKNPFSENETKSIIKLIENLRIVDPAVGSGAFPMRILHKLVFLLHKLDPENEFWKQAQLFEIENSDISPELKSSLKTQIGKSFAKSNHNYSRKLFLIQKCIYGVDLQQIAVEIAKLRFFISLLVDEAAEPDQIEPLPNLDFKLMQGNSLVSKIAGIDVTEKEKSVSLFDELSTDIDGIIKEFERLKGEYQYEPDAGKKKVLRQKIDAIIIELFEHKIFQYNNAYKTIKEKAAQLPGDKQRTIYIEDELKKLSKGMGINLTKAIDELQSSPVERRPKDFFLWKVYFAEVFAVKGGFDIVIGNPPYIQLQSMQQEAELLEKENYTTFKKSGDIYCLFYELGFRLLAEKGNLIYITGSAWIRSDYGSALRNFFREYTNPIKLLDLSDSKVFETPTVLTSILQFKKEPFKNNLSALRITRKTETEISALSNYYNQNAAKLLVSGNASWSISNVNEALIKETVLKSGKKLAEWNIEIYRGVLTGFNEAFVIDEETRERLIKEDKKSAELIKPLLRGRDVGRYNFTFEDKYLIATFPVLNIDIDKYPAIKKHLLTFGKPRLEQSGKPGARKKTVNKWFETQDQIRYWGNFEEPKIIYPNMVKDIGFAYDDSGYYTNDKTFLLTGEKLKFLLGVLNSKLFRFCFEDHFPELQGNSREIKSFVMKEIPIIVPKQIEHDVITYLVDLICVLANEEKTKRRKLNYDTALSVLSCIIDIIVYELYFSESMRSNGLGVVNDLKSVLKNSKPDMNSVRSFINWFDNEQNPVRAKLKQLKQKSPELLGCIEERGL